MPTDDPSCFSPKEFQRLTDRIETLTKARDTLTEFLHELENQRVDPSVPYSASSPDVFSSQQSPSGIPSRSNRSSPPEKAHYPHTSSSSSSSNQSASRDAFSPDHSATTTDTNEHHPPSTHPIHRPRSPSMTPTSFIRVHFPNKHTTAVRARVPHRHRLPDRNISFSSSFRLHSGQMRLWKSHWNRVH